MAFLAGGAGLWRIGLAVGWLVGAWLFGPKQKKNEIFDPGAEEMPRWNTSLRGITMPVAFGTNRISCQMCWQHDYTVERNEDGQSGGKFGGSGGGKAAQGQAGVSYIYKWDMVFHLAMVPTRVNLIKGWLGATRISDETIYAIVTSTAGAIEYVGGDNKNSEQEKVSMNFADAFFYKGSGPGLVDDDPALDDAGWDEILTDEGIPIRWPHTAWVGFKQLNLGQSPNVPMISFEIGPGEVTVEDKSQNNLYSAEDTNNSSNTVYGRYISGAVPNFKGRDGLHYAVDTRSVSTSKNVILYRLDFDAETAVVVQTFNDASFDTYRQSLSINPPFIENGVDIMEKCGAHVLNPFDYFMVTGIISGDVVYDYVVHLLFEIDESSNVRLINGGYKRFSMGVPQVPNVHMHCAIANSRQIDDPILMITHFGITSTASPMFWLLPSISVHLANNGIIEHPSFGDNDAYLATGLGSHFCNWESYRQFIAYFWTDSVGTSTRLWLYIGPSDINKYNDGATRSSSVMAGYATGYPNGFIGYWNIGNLNLYEVDGDGAAKIATALAFSPTYAGSMFVNSDLTAAFPFPGTNLYADGVTTETKHRADYDPHPAVYKMKTGTFANQYLIIFSSMLEDYSVDMINDGVHSTWARSIAFGWNPLLSKYVKLKELEFEPVDRGDDFGGSDSDLYYSRFRMAIFEETSGSAFLFAHMYGDVSRMKRYFIASAWQSLSLQGGEDVYPPYIIREILTNPFFGIGLRDDQIDSASYTAAIAYCQTNNFKVSVQFRREQGVLEAIDDVLSTYGGFLSISNGVVKFKQLEYQDGAATPVRTIDNHRLLVDEPGAPPVAVTKGALQDTFNKIRVNYFDRTLEYAQNQVEEADEVDQDLNGIRMREFPAIFVMDEQMARTMATRALWSNLYARDTYNFSLGWKDQDLEPGDVITLQDSYHPALSNGVVCRIITWKESKRGKFDVTAKQEFEYMLAASASALNITSASFVNRSGKMPELRDAAAWELPVDLDPDRNLMIGWSTWGFAAGAELYVSADGVSYARALKIDPYLIHMNLLGGLPDNDNKAANENVEVVMYPTSDYWYTGSVFHNATLGNVDQAGRAIGASLCWVGSELIAYEGVTLVDQNRYRLSKVYRGQSGTPIHSHNSGETMFKIGGGIFKQPLRRKQIGSTIYYKVRPYNLYGAGPEITSLQAYQYVVTGAGFKPRPVQDVWFSNSGDQGGKTTFFVGSQVDINVSWRRVADEYGYGARGYGVDTYGEFTIGSNYYRVNVVGSGGVVVRSTVVNSPTFNYTSSMNIADNGAWRGNVAFDVRAQNPQGLALRSAVTSLELWI